jgi:hypothetical protein
MTSNGHPRVYTEPGSTPQGQLFRPSSWPCRCICTCRREDEVTGRPGLPRLQDRGSLAHFSAVIKESPRLATASAPLAWRSPLTRSRSKTMSPRNPHPQRHSLSLMVVTRHSRVPSPGEIQTEEGSPGTLAYCVPTSRSRKSGAQPVSYLALGIGYVPTGHLTDSITIFFGFVLVGGGNERSCCV